MNVVGLATFLLDIVVEFLVKNDNLERIIKEILGLIPDVIPLEVTSAIEDLKVQPSAESLANVGKALESTGSMSAERFASVLVNNTTAQA